LKGEDNVNNIKNVVPTSNKTNRLKGEDNVNNI
jgi:hypothetical protein